jgi:hypothetical protein
MRLNYMRLSNPVQTEKRDGREVFTTSDGKYFYTRAKAEAHEAKFIRAGDLVSGKTSGKSKSVMTVARGRVGPAIRRAKAVECITPRGMADFTRYCQKFAKTPGVATNNRYHYFEVVDQSQSASEFNQSRDGHFFSKHAQLFGKVDALIRANPMHWELRFPTLAEAAGDRYSLDTLKESGYLDGVRILMDAQRSDVGDVTPDRLYEMWVAARWNWLATHESDDFSDVYRGPISRHLHARRAPSWKW